MQDKICFAILVYSSGTGPHPWVGGPDSRLRQSIVKGDVNDRF